MRAAGSVEQEQTARMCKADHDLHSHENKSKIANGRIGLILSKARPCFNVSYMSIENTVGKGAIALYEQLLLFLQCFRPFWRTFRHFHQVQDVGY